MVFTILIGFCRIKLIVFTVLISYFFYFLANVRLVVAVLSADLQTRKKINNYITIRIFDN